MTTTATTAKPASVDADDQAQAANALQELLDTGKFAAYHLRKARLALAANDTAAALYQVTASLAHETTAEAVALKAELKAELKARSKNR